MRVRLESNQMIWDEHSRNNISKSIKLLQSAKHNNSCALLCFLLLLTSSSFNPRGFNGTHIIRGVIVRVIRDDIVRDDYAGVLEMAHKVIEGVVVDMA